MAGIVEYLAVQGFATNYIDDGKAGWIATPGPPSSSSGCFTRRSYGMNGFDR